MSQAQGDILTALAKNLAKAGHDGGAEHSFALLVSEMQDRPGEGVCCAAYLGNKNFIFAGVIKSFVLEHF